MKNSNNAPSLKWVSVDYLHSIRRQRLFIDGRETPYFIDDSKGVAAFRTQGDRYGLYGAGMSERGHAIVLSSANRIPPLKHRAEQMAMSAPPPQLKATRNERATGIGDDPATSGLSRRIL